MPKIIIPHKIPLASVAAIISAIVGASIWLNTVYQEIASAKTDILDLRETIQNSNINQMEINRRLAKIEGKLEIIVNKITRN